MLYKILLNTEGICNYLKNRSNYKLFCRNSVDRSKMPGSITYLKSNDFNGDAFIYV